MKSTTFINQIKILRGLILIYCICAIWFIFTPDSIPQVLRDAEREIDQPLFSIVDKTIVFFLYIRTILCIFLWKPTRLIFFLFLIAETSIIILSTLSGPAILSASDTLFDTIQTLSEGAIVIVLFLGNIHVKNNDKNNTEI